MSTLTLQEDEVTEFMTEATENLDSGEAHLLKMDRGEPFVANYDAAFRAFHSIKGVAGMLGMDALQSHLHQLETQLQNCRSNNELSKEQISYFLKGIDSTRQLLKGEAINFDYNFPSASAPSAREQTPAPAKKPTSIQQIESSTFGFAVVIDDDLDMTEFLSDTLKNSGFTVHGFTDPSEAIKKLPELKPDLIFSDMKMPKMTGLEVLNEVVKFNSDIPVIFSSGYLTKEDLIEAITLGVFGILEKPFQESQLVTMALNAVHKHKFVKLLNRSINFMMFQLTDLENYLEQSGQPEAKNHLQKEIKMILEARRELKKIKSA